MFFGIVNILCGTPNKNKIDLERLGVIISHEPGGASIQNVLQWIQFYRHREMKKFDHGKKKNKQIYDSEEPPSYNFEHLDSLPFNTHIFKGTKDAVISEKNFSLLKTKMNAERTKVYDL